MERACNAKKYAEYLERWETSIDQLINKHIKTLALKHSQLAEKDDYGNYIDDKWFKEIDHFIKIVMMKENNIREYLLVDDDYQSGIKSERTQHIIEKIINAVSEYKIDQIGGYANIDVESLDPIQYEHYCADNLNASGWDARVTKASGDQGVDVIATRGNIKAVFQCKKYSQPIGNAAVQEIIAGKHFEQADIAAVVSNATYTPSAKKLASTTGVYLLHHGELMDFANKLNLA